MRPSITVLTICICVLATSIAKADLLLFDIDADPLAWANAIAGGTPSIAYDFDLDPDYGIQGFDGPLTSAGAGPVSAGNLAVGVTMDRINNGGGDPGLVGVGPLAGFGNASNAVLANFFVDAFAVLSFGGPIEAFEFNALTILGSGNVDLTLHDDQGIMYLFPGVSVGTGTNLGVLATNNMFLTQIDIFDVTGSGGAEGVQGAGTIYSGLSVPEPSTVALFGMGLIGFGFSRKRSRK